MGSTAPPLYPVCVCVSVCDCITDFLNFVSMQQALIYLVEGVLQQVVLGSAAALGGFRRALGTHSRAAAPTLERVQEVVQILFLFFHSCFFLLLFFYIQASCPILYSKTGDANASVRDNALLHK